MQNILKSIFVTCFFVVCIILFLYSIVQMVINGTALGFSWFGAFISSAAVVSFLIGLYTKNKARTPKVLWSLLIGVFMGLAVVLYAGLRDVNVGYTGSEQMAALGMQWQPLIITLFICCGSILYIFWYSKLGRADAPSLRIGHGLPQFLVKNSAGASVSSKDLSRQPAIIMFYQGNWCPFCLAQVQELVDEYEQLQTMGVNVWLISPQPKAESEKLAAKHQMKFELMQDVDNVAAKQLNIFHPHGVPAGMQLFGYPSGTVYPTMIVVDKNQKIIWVDKTDNYRVRPEPSEFMQALESARW